jgi:hypothetical protein
MSVTTKNTTTKLQRASATSKDRSAERTPSLVLDPQSPSTVVANGRSSNFLKDAAEHLLTWMQRMEKSDATADNVHAVCNLAKQMCTIVQTNIELKKNGF